MKSVVVVATVASSLVVAGFVAANGRDGAGDGSASSPGAPTVASASPSPQPSATSARPRRGKGTGAWHVSRQSTRHEIEAYTSRVSGRPGVPLELKVSTPAKTYRATAYRFGAYRGGWGHEVWRSGPVRGRVQPAPVFAPAETRTVVARWGTDLVVDTTSWEPGYYAVKLETPAGWQTRVPYVVSSPSARGTIALVAPVTTWQAYNAWGGYSLYEGPNGDRRSWAVSFDRPYAGPPGANDYRLAALPIVTRAEALGVPLSYFTNVDLHLDPAAIEGARGYMSLGHDEYWTPQMRQVVTRARDAGTNLAFLGANTMYWRIRLEDRPTGPARLVVGYRDDAYTDPVRHERPSETSARWRDGPAPRPENSLVGMQYECYPVDADYVVVSPGWWGFRGTGVRAGTRIPGLVGPEADRVYPDRHSPKTLQVLSHSTYDCRGVPTSTQSVYYTAASGAGVFTAGTLRWGCALIDACEHPLGPGAGRFVSRVTANLLRAYAAGPVARRHPAQPNVDRFDLATTNSVDAS
jgi:hypothetical protein